MTEGQKGYADSIWAKIKYNYLKAEKGLDEYYVVDAIAQTIDEAWESVLKLGGALDALNQNIAGEDKLMFVAQTTRQIYLSSRSLQTPLHILPRYDDKTGDFSNRLYHTPDSFTDPSKTPDLTPIRVITDAVMTQLNLDITGMANCLTVLDHLSEWGNTKLMTSKHMKNVLKPKTIAKPQYDHVVRKYNEFLNSYNTSWDSLFQ